jgi:hypothetical protein
MKRGGGCLGTLFQLDPDISDDCDGLIGVVMAGCICSSSGPRQRSRNRRLYPPTTLTSFHRVRLRAHHQDSMRTSSSSRRRFSFSTSTRSRILPWIKQLSIGLWRQRNQRPVLPPCKPLAKDTRDNSSIRPVFASKFPLSAKTWQINAPIFHSFQKPYINSHPCRLNSSTHTPTNAVSPHYFFLRTHINSRCRHCGGGGRHVYGSPGRFCSDPFSPIRGGMETRFDQLSSDRYLPPSTAFSFLYPG